MIPNLSEKMKKLQTEKQTAAIHPELESNQRPNA